MQRLNVDIEKEINELFENLELDDEVRTSPGVRSIVLAAFSTGFKILSNAAEAHGVDRKSQAILNMLGAKLVIEVARADDQDVEKLEQMERAVEMLEKLTQLVATTGGSTRTPTAKPTREEQDAEIERILSKKRDSSQAVDESEDPS